MIPPADPGYERRRAVAARLRSSRDAIAAAATDAFLDRRPDWIDRYGELARRRGEEDAAFHVEFLAGAVLADDVSAFEDYARWTAGVLFSRGIAPEHLAENLEDVRRAAASLLEEDDRDVVARFVEGGIGALERGGPDDDAIAREAPDADASTTKSLYLQAVLYGERRAALNVALEAVRAGASVPDVYADVLQPAQRDIGRMWERNEITVAREHMATAITQYVVGRLYTLFEMPERWRGNAIVTGVEGELHQLGANMVADVLEAAGWNMRFLGTQLPHRGVLEAIEAHEPRLLGISTTVLSNLPAAADLVAAARRSFGSDLRILVGGAAFGHGTAWREIGADAYGRDLRDAVAVADELVPRDG